MSDLTSPSTVTPGPADGGVFMVLLVDDQAMIGEAVRRILAPQPDIDFHYCANPAEALATAHRVQPTVILQDLVMPGVHGLDLLRQYRADVVTKEMPVQISTVALVCETDSCNGRARVGWEIEDGKKRRVCRKCGGDV